jgi:hypothetical protein
MVDPSMTLPEMIFGGLVLACFAAFATTLAGVHLYVSLPPRRQRKLRPVELPVGAIGALAGEIV